MVEPGKTTTEQSLRDYLRIIFRRKWLFFFPFVLGALITIPVAFFLGKPIYEATAVVRRLERAPVRGAGGLQYTVHTRATPEMIQREVTQPRILRKVIEQLWEKELQNISNNVVRETRIQMWQARLADKTGISIERRGGGTDYILISARSARILSSLPSKYRS